MISTGDPKRSDDRIGTILAMAPQTPVGLARLWRQLVDLLAQGGDHLSVEDTQRALAALSVIRQSVPEEAREGAVTAVAKRCRSAPLAVLLAGGSNASVAALFDDLMLDDAQWLAVIPAIGPLARSRLRLRRDRLSPPVRHALAMYTQIDFALPDHAAVTTVDSAPVTVLRTGKGADRADIEPQADLPPTHDSSIAGLVQRIEEWRQRRGHGSDSPAAAASVSSAVHLLVDADGIVRAVDGLPRAAVCGLSLAEAARPTETGVDAGVARAVSKRTRIENGRLLIAPGLPWSGLWTLDGDAQFDEASGRFTGYRIEMRPNVAASPPIVEDTTPDVGDRQLAEATRQMVHELRSPLNAISGFAQLIEGQYFGPVSSGYRAITQSIRKDADSLLRAFEDLNTAAMIDLGQTDVATDVADAAAMLESLADGEEGTVFTIASGGGPSLVAIAPSSLHQLLGRLVQLARDGGAGAVGIWVERPGDSAMVRITFDRGFSGIHDDVADGALGSAFSARIAQRLAERLGGSLQFSLGKAILNLPRAMEAAERVVIL